MTDPSPTPPMQTAPVRFLGMQPGFGGNPAIELYVLLSNVGHHPVGSTVSRQTLEKHGFLPLSVQPKGSASIAIS